MPISMQYSRISILGEDKKRKVEVPELIETPAQNPIFCGRWISRFGHLDHWGGGGGGWGERINQISESLTLVS